MGARDLLAELLAIEERVHWAEPIPAPLSAVGRFPTALLCSKPRGARRPAQQTRRTAQPDCPAQTLAGQRRRHHPCLSERARERCRLICKHGAVNSWERQAMRCGS